jgi:hypothetical protein
MTLDPVDGVAALLGSTVGRPSRFLPPGVTGDPVRIAAGRPDLSVVVARMRARDPLVRMPPVGTTVVDEEGLALIDTRLLSGHPAQLVMPPAPVLAPSAPWNATVGATMTAWSGPWGTSFTANLTPDKETGLGGWTVRNFVETIRNGKHQGRGRPLLPPMPWNVYANFTDEDLESIFAYLQSIPPVKNRVPQPLPPAPVTASK